MSWTTRLHAHQVALDEIRYGVRHSVVELGAYTVDRIEMRQLLDPMIIELTTAVLSECLPTERVTRRRREGIETARFATWWDHWKVTYRGRWWMRWRRWSVRQLVDVHEIEAIAAVDLDRHWTFPRAAISVPELGDPVRVVQWTAVDVTQPNGVTTRSATDRIER